MSLLLKIAGHGAGRLGLPREWHILASGMQMGVLTSMNTIQLRTKFNVATNSSAKSSGHARQKQADGKIVDSSPSDQRKKYKYRVTQFQMRKMYDISDKPVNSSVAVKLRTSKVNESSDASTIVGDYLTGFDPEKDVVIEGSAPLSQQEIERKFPFRSNLEVKEKIADVVYSVPFGSVRLDSHNKPGVDKLEIISQPAADISYLQVPWAVRDSNSKSGKVEQRRRKRGKTATIDQSAHSSSVTNQASFDESDVSPVVEMDNEMRSAVQDKTAASGVHHVLAEPDNYFDHQYFASDDVKSTACSQSYSDRPTQASSKSSEHQGLHESHIMGLYGSNIFSLGLDSSLVIILL